MKNILLSDYREVLLAYEDDYRQSKGGDRHAVVAQIIEQITSEDKGKGKFKDEVVKGLESVSQLFINSSIQSRDLIHFNPENPELVQQPQECPIGG